MIRGEGSSNYYLFIIYLLQFYNMQIIFIYVISKNSWKSFDID